MICGEDSQTLNYCQEHGIKNMKLSRSKNVRVAPGGGQRIRPGYGHGLPPRITLHPGRAGEMSIDAEKGHLRLKYLCRPSIFPLKEFRIHETLIEVH